MTSRQSAVFNSLNLSLGYANNRIAGCGYSTSGYMLGCGGHTYTYFSDGKVKTANAQVDFQYDGKGRLSRTYVVAPNEVLADMYVEPLGRLSRFESDGGAALSPAMDWIYAAGQMIASVDYGASCDCQPKTCESEQVPCGTISDGCGGSVYCGACGGVGCSIGGPHPTFGMSGSSMLQKQDQGDQLGGAGPIFCNDTDSAIDYSMSVSFSPGEAFSLTLPQQDTIPPRTAYTWPALFDSRSLAPGTYHATIAVTTSTHPGTLLIPVTFEVSAAPPPQDSSSVTGRLRWYVADHRGSTMMVLDSAGKVVANYEYFPFGEQKLSSACLRNEGMYQGSLRDQTANLYDIGARHETPQFGRFMVPDVAWPDLRLPTEWNRYVYAANDPINLIDLLGYAATTPHGGTNPLRNAHYSSDPHGLETVAEVAVNKGGEVLSTVLLMDTIVDGVAVAGDSTNSLGARVWGGTKALGAVALDVTLARVAVVGVRAGVRGLTRLFVGGEAAARGLGSVVLDTNAVIAAVEKGRAAAVLAGRTPLVPITAAKEFLRGGGSIEALKAFLTANGGRVALAGEEATAVGLRAQAAGMGRVLGTADARIAASAVREGTAVITNDIRFANFLREAGIPVGGF